jgi:hypothetical protein
VTFLFLGVFEAKALEKLWFQSKTQPVLKRLGYAVKMTDGETGGSVAYQGTAFISKSKL